MHIHHEEVSVNIQIITLDGRIDAASVPALKESLRTMTREGRCNIVLDLRDVIFIDSTGLGLLASLLRASRACGGDVCLVMQTDSPVAPILNIVRFHEVFVYYATPEEAISHFARQ